MTLRNAQLLKISIISLAVLSAACVRETESGPPAATPEPIALPTIQPTSVAWLLNTDEEQVVVLDWSPDGEWVVYGEAFGFDEEFLDYLMYSLLAVSTRTGEVRELAETVSGLRIYD